MNCEALPLILRERPTKGYCAILKFYNYSVEILKRNNFHFFFFLELQRAIKSEGVALIGYQSFEENQLTLHKYLIIHK
jgi:hypothetical protein